MIAYETISVNFTVDAMALIETMPKFLALEHCVYDTDGSGREGYRLIVDTEEDVFVLLFFSDKAISRRGKEARQQPSASLAMSCLIEPGSTAKTAQRLTNGKPTALFRPRNFSPAGRSDMKNWSGSCLIAHHAQEQANYTREQKISCTKKNCASKTCPRNGFLM